MNKYIHRYHEQFPEICICKFKNGDLVSVAFETNSYIELAEIMYLCTVNEEIEKFWFSTMNEYILDYDIQPEDILQIIQNEMEQL